jgi:general secretion pathway protein G
MKMPNCSRRLARRAAFTLIELLVVIVIIGILAAMILGLAGHAGSKAARSRALAELEHLKNGVEEYRVEYGRYPEYKWTGANASTGLVGLLWSVPRQNNRQPYYLPKNVTNAAPFRPVPVLDPWGRDYLYSNITVNAYRIWSRGPDTATDVDDIETAAGKQ